MCEGSDVVPVGSSQWLSPHLVSSSQSNVDTAEGGKYRHVLNGNAFRCLGRAVAIAVSVHMQLTT